jgi:hypothetical protein
MLAPVLDSSGRRQPELRRWPPEYSGTFFVSVEGLKHGTEVHAAVFVKIVPFGVCVWGFCFAFRTAFTTGYNARPSLSLATGTNKSA